MGKGIEASIKVHNLDTMERWLQQLPVEVSKGIMAKGITAGGNVVLKAARTNIHSRTGKTAADLRVEVQVKDETSAVAAVGGTRKGRTGRAFVLKWLEWGTKAHTIQPHVAGKKQINQAARALARLDRTAAARFLMGVATGRIRRAKSALWWKGAKHPMRSVNHRATAPQSPLTRALADQGDTAIKVTTDTWWQGIVAASLRAWRTK